MSLYDIVRFEIGATGMVAIPPGALAVGSIVLVGGGVYTAMFMQVANTQDFSMRVWISDQVDGLPLGMPTDFWAMTRVAQGVTLADPAAATASGPMPSGRRIQAQPGTYFMHVQNLCNQENVFAVGNLALP